MPSSCTCNINVCCRIKPSKRLSISSPFHFSPLHHSIHDKGRGTTFQFDRIFPADCSQSDLFEKVGSSFVQDVFNGYNSTVIAYGQTGSGKTYTMFGSFPTANTEYANDAEVLNGIVPACLEYLFATIQHSSPDLEFTVKVSFLEIYMEKVRDLLGTNAESQNLSIVQESGNSAWPVGLSSYYVVTANECIQLLMHGHQLRQVSSTKMNQLSSRSHCIFQLVLTQRNTHTNVQTYSKMTFVDLAGSERVDKTGAVGRTLEEAKKINKSLSSLGNVINALSKRETAGEPSLNAHIPYRDSKLTRILQDALGGNSKTCLIVTVTMDTSDYEESLSTLRFGERAKAVQNEAVVNVQISEEDELRKELLRAREEIELLRSRNFELERIQLGDDGREEEYLENSQHDSAQLKQSVDALSEEMVAELEAMKKTCHFYQKQNMQLLEKCSRLSTELEEKKEELKRGAMKESESKEEIEKLQIQIDSLSCKTSTQEDDNNHSVSSVEQQATKETEFEKRKHSHLVNLTEIENELKVFNDDEYSKYLESSEEESKEIVDYINSIITGNQLPSSNSNKDNTLKNDTNAISPSIDYSFINAEGTSSDEVKRAHKGLLLQSYEFDKLKRTLMKHLQEKCEKIVELERQLDEQQEKLSLSLKSTDSAVLHDKVEIMEKNMRNILQRQSELHQQNLSLADSVETAEMKLTAREEKVRFLEEMVESLAKENAQLKSNADFSIDAVQLRSPTGTKLVSGAFGRAVEGNIRRPLVGGSQLFDFMEGRCEIRKSKDKLI